jgi:hypothetical protein
LHDTEGGGPDLPSVSEVVGVVPHLEPICAVGWYHLNLIGRGAEGAACHEQDRDYKESGQLHVEKEYK